MLEESINLTHKSKDTLNWTPKKKLKKKKKILKFLYKEIIVVQKFRRIHSHIHLDYAKLKFLSYIKNIYN